MIDKRLGYIAVIALTAAGLTALVLAPRDSVSLALGMGRTALPVDQQITVTALGHSDAGVAIDAGWFDASRCKTGNGMVSVKIGDGSFALSRYDVAQIDLDWRETWSQAHTQSVVLHRESGCAEKPIVARSLRTVSQGSFPEGMVVWPSKTTKRENSAYVDKIKDLKNSAECYADRDVRICRDPEAPDDMSGVGFYAFVDDADLPSGAPANLRCRAEAGRVDHDAPQPLRGLTCQIADIDPDGFSFSTQVKSASMFNAYQFKQWMREIRQNLSNIEHRA